LEVIGGGLINMLSCDTEWLETGFGSLTGFIGLFDTVRCYTLNSLLDTHYCQQSHLHCRCLVAASNGERSHSSVFLNGPQPQLQATNCNSSPQPNSSSLLTNCNKSKSCQGQSYVTIDGQSASLSWCQTAFGANEHIFVAARELLVFMWGAISGERMGLPFTTASAVTFTAIRVSSICHLYLQLYTSALYILVVVKSPVPCEHLLFTVIYVTLMYMYVHHIQDLA
jgi:hypothetical protein